MDWLGLAVLGGIWAILLVPSRPQGSSPIRRPMPYEEEDFAQPGRWILSPKRGSRFLGRRQRAHLRAADRRRRVILFLLEAIAVSGLIGLFPPLRGMLILTGVFSALLVAFLGLAWATGGRRRSVRTPALASPSAEGGDVLVVLPEAQGRLEEDEERLVRIAR